jgi:HPt (histidine-containing phosphotransfer) domain-containing protein
MPDNAVYLDYADGVKRLMNNGKFYAKLLSKFKDETKLDDLEAFLAEGDMEKAQNAAHAIKGLAANLSLPEMFKQCLELEAQIKAKTVPEKQMETVKAAFAMTLQEIDKVIAVHE